MCPSLNQSLVREMEYSDWSGLTLALLTDNDVNCKGPISILQLLKCSANVSHIYHLLIVEGKY